MLSRRHFTCRREDLEPFSGDPFFILNMECPPFNFPLGIFSCCCSDGHTHPQRIPCKPLLAKFVPLLLFFCRIWRDRYASLKTTMGHVICLLHFAGFGVLQIIGRWNSPKDLHWKWNYWHGIGIWYLAKQLIDMRWGLWTHLSFVIIDIRWTKWWLGDTLIPICLDLRLGHFAHKMVTYVFVMDGRFKWNLWIRNLPT